MIDRGRHNLIGVNINAVDYEAAVATIVEAAQTRQPLGVSALAVHGVMTGVLDDEHRHRLNQLELVVPDGQPVRWALNWLHGTQLTDRVYGPNLMLKTCAAAAQAGLGIFLFGGKPELLELLKKNLQDKYPQLTISGMQASRFRQLDESEREEVVQTIRDSGASICLVGLGCPRQEVWAYEFKDQLSMPVLAVGAAFNFHAGLLDQAPPFWQRNGLEWLYRLIKEPVRLWRRYLLLNPLYVSMVCLQMLGLKRFDPQSAKAPTKQFLYG